MYVVDRLTGIWLDLHSSTFANLYLFINDTRADVQKQKAQLGSDVVLLGNFGRRRSCQDRGNAQPYLSRPDRGFNKCRSATDEPKTNGISSHPTGHCTCLSMLQPLQPLTTLITLSEPLKPLTTSGNPSREPQHKSTCSHFMRVEERRCTSCNLLI